MKLPLWIIGAVCIASGIITMAMGGIGVPAGPTATVFGTLGYDALPDLVLNSQGFLALGLVGVGVALMVGANASAWKETGGY
ncbi:MAG: hypothetical protein H6742_17325 [Alphaproteobacteria bacterium]|nr:hypothetical protein [Alphaproteobacteria bacterium]